MTKTEKNLEELRKFYGVKNKKIQLFDGYYLLDNKIKREKNKFVHAIFLDGKILKYENAVLLYILHEETRYNSESDISIYLDYDGHMTYRFKTYQMNEAEAKQGYIQVENIDTNLLFIKIEPDLVKKYGTGWWVVYQEQGCFLFKTYKEAHAFRLHSKQSALICILGYDTEQVPWQFFGYDEIGLII